MASVWVSTHSQADEWGFVHFDPETRRVGEVRVAVIPTTRHGLAASAHLKGRVTTARELRLGHGDGQGLPRPFATERN